MKQFPLVNCSRGAPMGRAEYYLPNDPDNLPARSVSVFRVRLSGDYDDGGAYWGCESHGIGLYCARSDNGEYRRFVRAASRAKAISALEIPPEWLKQPVKVQS